MGYVVLQPTQKLRALEHSGQCKREGCPKVVVVTTTKYKAKVMLDTAPGGYRLTRDAVALILARFEEFDPKGRHCFVINEELAVIRGVPAHRAEELAAALVSIAKDGSMQVPGRASEAGL